VCGGLHELGEPPANDITRRDSLISSEEQSVAACVLCVPTSTAAQYCGNGGFLVLFSTPSKPVLSRNM
jgi:hypothetical protein